MAVNQDRNDSGDKAGISQPLGSRTGEEGQHLVHQQLGLGTQAGVGPYVFRDEEVVVESSTNRNQWTRLPFPPGDPETSPRTQVQLEWKFFFFF